MRDLRFTQDAIRFNFLNEAFASRGNWRQILRSHEKALSFSRGTGGTRRKCDAFHLAFDCEKRAGEYHRCRRVCDSIINRRLPVMESSKRHKNGSRRDSRRKMRQGENSQVEVAAAIDLPADTW
ncbi:hypothetical protein RUM44_001664 [Polyplax serrata]|uniref:Uncharacterized protein n=1 Tax=Polyplax serrata TaxID=468196 RepID=A0ABR1AKP4_POLSC